MTEVQVAQESRDVRSRPRGFPFRVDPISGALGAEIHGVDIAQDLDDVTIGAIRQALLDHCVIFGARRCTSTDSRRSPSRT